MRNKHVNTEQTTGRLESWTYDKDFRIFKWKVARIATLDSDREPSPSLEPEMSRLVKLIADVATRVWRARKQFDSADPDTLPRNLVKAQRHIDSVFDSFAEYRIEIRDHTNERYVTGMALKVIAFQPVASADDERIVETVKPSVFFKDELVQLGEVIVETAETRSD